MNSLYLALLAAGGFLILNNSKKTSPSISNTKKVAETSSEGNSKLIDFEVNVEKPKNDNQIKPVENKENVIIKLMDGQVAYKVPSAINDPKETAPLILFIINSTSEKLMNGIPEGVYSILKIIPENLQGHVFIVNSRSNKNFSGDRYVGDGNIMIKSIKFLLKLYSTSKIIATTVDNIDLLSYLAILGAVDGIYLIDKYQTSNNVEAPIPIAPAPVNIIGWLIKDEVNLDNWEKEAFSLAFRMQQFALAYYPVATVILAPKIDQKGASIPTPSSVKYAIDKLISIQNYIPYKDDPGFKMEKDGDLECAIIVTDPSKAAIAMATTIIDAVKSVGKKVSSVQEFWNYFNSFFNIVNSNCWGKKTYFDSPNDAMYTYWAIRGTLRALVTRDLMDFSIANKTLLEAKLVALSNGVNLSHSEEKKDYERNLPNLVSLSEQL